jgi:putative ABC transport system permease protein
VINYVNLTTAGYKYRLTEIGVKKCLGISARILRTQLLAESLWFCLFAALGMVIAEIFLPHFSQFVGKPLPIEIFTSLRAAFLFLGFILFLSLAAGFLPAVILSKYRLCSFSSLNRFQRQRQCVPKCSERVSVWRHNRSHLLLAGDGQTA